MVLLNREGGFHTGSRPMENCRPAIIVSFGVTAHWLPQKGNREAGIDSVAEFRGLMPFGHPRFETPRSALVPQAFLPVFFRGWAMAIFIFLTSPLQPKCAYAFE
jgi:hypothetical protein